MKTIITIVGGRPEGYITVDELAFQSGVDPQCIRANIHRGNLQPLTIGYGRWKTHWFPRDFLFEHRKPGRPKKKEDST